MEELLRAYFLRAGYFVVRGVPFVYEGLEVTDIDLWLYGRSSGVSREIIIVDSKNKKTPQALERIFWVQGLKQATGATKAIVATTDRKKEIKDFGSQMGVLVLDGAFLSKLRTSDEVLISRLTDEDLFAKITAYALDKIDGNWVRRIRFCKGLLSRGLSFDNSIEWLGQGQYFAEQAIVKPTQREVSLRCLYLVCSLIAVSIDFSLREIAFAETPERTNRLLDGFTYGTKGAAGLKRVLDTSMGLVEQFANNGSQISHQVRLGVERQLSLIPSNVLADYFSRIEVAGTLFSVGREFENLSMQREFTTHSGASVELRSMMGCLLDFWKIDRAGFSPAG